MRETAADSTAVVAGLTTIKEALTNLAFAVVSRNGRPVPAFVGVLESIDAMIQRWEGLAAPSPDDLYRLGLLLGMLAHMAACRVDPQGELTPMLVNSPTEDPAGVAAAALRDAVLTFTGATVG